MIVNHGNVFTFGNFHIIVNYKTIEDRDNDVTIYIQLYEGNQAKEQM